MGQWYYVELDLKYTDEKAVVKAANEYITSAEKKLNARFDKRYGFNTVSNIVKSILAEFQGDYYEEGNGLYTSSFDATYSWESVLAEFFTAIKHSLNKGSRIDVWPDTGHWSDNI